MPLAVTAFSVKVAASSEKAIEADIVREVVADWNSSHARCERRVLVPMLETEAPSGDSIDLLIAFFCAAEGDALELAEAAEEMEIEGHLAGGRPALIYFSKARVDLASTQGLRARALGEIRAAYPTATVDSYGDEKEFRAKFAFQLDDVIGRHPYFQLAETSLAAPPLTPPPVKAPPVVPLSEHARLILIEACDDFEAYIGRIKLGDTVRIQANGKQLVDQSDKAAAAVWDAAFHELLHGGFIRDAGYNGQLFQISAKGFEFLKSIGKTPVGYIAELGGM